MNKVSIVCPIQLMPEQTLRIRWDTMQYVKPYKSVCVDASERMNDRYASVNWTDVIRFS